MKVNFDVIQQDIDQGTRKVCETCPIALAAIRSSVVNPVIFSTEIWYTIGKGLDRSRCKSPLPTEASRFIEDFDMGLPVKPFTFSIEVDAV